MNVVEGTTNSPTPPDAAVTPTPPDPANPTPNGVDPKTELNEDGTPKSLIEVPKPDEAPTEFVPLTAEDITIPDGLEINDAARDEALALVNNRDLSPKEQLQGLIDLQAKLAKEASEAISETWETTQKTWQDEVKADPTIGGDKLPATLSEVNKLVTEYGSPELVEVFATTGAGNNVHVIKFLHSVAGKLLEGKPVTTGAPPNQETDRASRMFPSMKG